MDWSLLAVAAGLALFGTLMVYSASAMIAQRESGGLSQFTYFYKQFLFTAIGLGVMLGASLIDYRRYQHHLIVFSALAVTVLLLLAVFGFPAINGAQRWIRFGGLSLQPSEIAKVSLPLFLAWFLTLKEDKMGDLLRTVLPCLVVVGIICGLVMMQPDLGTVFVLAASFGVVFFAAGAKWLHVGSVAGIVALMGAAAIYLAPWRVERVMAFLDPFEHSDDAGYQVVQSLYAIGSGGIVGEGFARGEAKLFYLPYPYSDFIFSVIGEEFGLIGTLAIVIAFGVILWRGAKAAIQAPDRFGTLLGIGLVTGIIIQALFNISVVISILPAKGIPLPFISYGGTSIIITMFAIGILLNISKHSGEKPVNNEKRPRKRAVKVKA